MAKKKIKCNVELKELVLDFFKNKKIEDKSYKSLAQYLVKFGYDLDDFKSMVMALCP